MANARLVFGGAILAAASAGAALAQTNPRDPYDNFSSSWARGAQALESPAVMTAQPRTLATDDRATAQRADRTISIDAHRSLVTVSHLESVRFVDSSGRSFFADALLPGTYPLKSISPVAFDSGKVWIAVVHPKDHTAR